MPAKSLRQKDANLEDHGHVYVTDMFAYVPPPDDSERLTLEVSKDAKVDTAVLTRTSPCIAPLLKSIELNTAAILHDIARTTDFHGMDGVKLNLGGSTGAKHVRIIAENVPASMQFTFSGPVSFLKTAHCFQVASVCGLPLYLGRGQEASLLAECPSLALMMRIVDKPEGANMNIVRSC